MDIPTERPPLVGEVSANFLRIEGVAWSAQRMPTAVNLGFLDQLKSSAVSLIKTIKRTMVLASEHFGQSAF
jgi:hypothetical protein